MGTPLRHCFPSPVPSAFSKTRLLLELRRILSCESPAVFLHTPLEEKGPWGPLHRLRRVLAKGRHVSTLNLTESTGPSLFFLLFHQCDKCLLSPFHVGAHGFACHESGLNLELAANSGNAWIPWAPNLHFARPLLTVIKAGHKFYSSEFD